MKTNSLMLLLLRSFIIGTGGETKMRALNIHIIYMAKYGLYLMETSPDGTVLRAWNWGTYGIVWTWLSHNCVHRSKVFTKGWTSSHLFLSFGLLLSNYSSAKKTIAKCCPSLLHSAYRNMNQERFNQYKSVNLWCDARKLQSCLRIYPNK